MHGRQIFPACCTENKLVTLYRWATWNTFINKIFTDSFGLAVNIQHPFTVYTSYRQYRPAINHVIHHSFDASFRETAALRNDNLQDRTKLEAITLHMKTCSFGFVTTGAVAESEQSSATNLFSVVVFTESI
jgi:hypothetical protein